VTARPDRLDFVRDAEFLLRNTNSLSPSMHDRCTGLDDGPPSLAWAAGWPEQLEQLERVPSRGRFLHPAAASAAPSPLLPAPHRKHDPGRRARQAPTCAANGQTGKAKGRVKQDLDEPG